MLLDSRNKGLLCNIKTTIGLREEPVVRLEQDGGKGI